MIKLYDTAGQEDYDQLRKSIYKQADSFLICYSVDSKTSFQNVKEYWVKEVRQVMGDVPIVLCGKFNFLWEKVHHNTPKPQLD